MSSKIDVEQVNTDKRVDDIVCISHAEIDTLIQTGQISPGNTLDELISRVEACEYAIAHLPSGGGGATYTGQRHIEVDNSLYTISDSIYTLADSDIATLEWSDE